MVQFFTVLRKICVSKIYFKFHCPLKKKIFFWKFKRSCDVGKFLKLSVSNFQLSYRYKKNLRALHRSNNY